MTKRTMLPLLLAVAGLAVGCQDAAKEPVKSLLEPTQKLEAPKKVEEQLTAVAPVEPVSILKGDDKKEDKPKSEEPIVFEIAHDEPELYDRALDAKDVVVDRFVLSSDVSGREPVQESDHFTSDNEKIFAFVQLANKDAPYAFTVHFEPVDGPAALYGVKLDVPTATRWRTWAWTKLMHEPGKYRAVLRTLEGEEIVAREFTIDEPAN
ncbi:MAG: hypothetical protein ABW352_17335 [Polyangiales bacterium]